MARNRDVSAIARGASMSAEFWLKLDRAVKDKGGSDKDIHRLATPSGDVALTCMVEELLKKDEATGAPRELPYYDEATGLYRYTVDCGAGSEDDFRRLLSTCNFMPHCINSGFTFSNFPLVTHSRWEIAVQLLHMNAIVDTQKVIGSFMESSLLRPDPEHVLGFAAAFPDVRRKFPIVGLINFPWQHCNADLLVPSLWEAELPKLCLTYFVRPWGEDFRFLALRNVRRLSV